MFKNVASQKVAVYAWNNAAGAEKTGDAGNITAQISIDGGVTAATNDVNPTELDATDAKGVYIFDMTQAESNGDLIIISPVSSTTDIVLRSVFIYTQTVMKGTDGANTTVPDAAGTAPTAVEIQTEMEENGASLLDTIRDDLANGTDGLGALKTLIDNLNDITTANVLTQVNAALDTAISELGVAAPTATPTLRTGLMLLYMTLRNRLDLDTGTNTKEIFNSAGTKITQKALTDDDTTYSEAKMS